MRGVEPQMPDPAYASRRYDCPQCSAPVTFHSSISLSSVCAHCRSLVVRRDFNVETFGQMAELPPDLSPLQLGTKGHWQGRAFTLIGRLRLHWGDGSWTEWCADFGGGTTGWLAEAQGFFMVSFAQTMPGLEQVDQGTSAGRLININGESWRVTDVKDARCIAAEGELPMIAPPGWSRTGIDLTGPGGQFGTIEITGEGRAFFAGEYAQFGDLHLTGLRKVPGWDQDAEITRRQSDALNCPSCGAPVNLRAEGQTMAAICGSCASILDASTPRLQEIGKVAQTTLKIRPLLPIGTRGVLKDEVWDIIGFMRRRDRWCAWDEYLIFNPWLGFRFLVTFNGHWSIVRLLPGHATDTQWNGESFRLFAREEVTTTDVLGEFYWRVRKDERAVVSDHIAPPHILTREESKQLNEVSWSGGEYIPHTEIAAAFRAAVPTPSGILLNQPNPHARRWDEVRTTFVFALIAYILVQVAFMGYGTQRIALNTTLAFQRQAADADSALVTVPFRLEGGSAPVHVTARSSLPADTYLGLKGSLVNAATQQTHPLLLPLSRWSTGADHSLHTATLPAVPSGSYYLRLDPDAAAGLDAAPVGLTVTRGGLFWSNFWLGLILICLWPLWHLLRSASFEKRRWMESDFA